MHLRLNFTDKQSETQKGASFLEFAITLPVFILVVFAFIDFSRYLFYQTIANTAASKALENAVIIPNLDLDNSQDSKFTTARQTVLNSVNTFGVEKYLHWSPDPNGGSKVDNPNNMELILPTPAFGETKRSAMKKTPIKVQLHGTFTPLFPIFPTISITGRASGYREIPNENSEPIPTDCAGNPLGSSSYGTGTGCSCSNPLQTYNWASKSCTCTSPLVDDGSGGCTCPSQYETLSTDANGNPVCSCLITNASCPGDLKAKVDETTCTCNCPGNQVQTGPSTCGCGAGYVSDGAGGCVCANQYPCSSGEIWETSSCSCHSVPTCVGNEVLNTSNYQCECPGGNDAENVCTENGGSYDSTNGSCSCSCSDPYVTSTKDGYASCACSPSQSAIDACNDGSGMSFSMSSCNCACPSGQSLYNGQCMPAACASSSTNCVWDSTAKTCTCPTAG